MKTIQHKECPREMNCDCLEKLENQIRDNFKLEYVRTEQKYVFTSSGEKKAISFPMIFICLCPWPPEGPVSLSKSVTFEFCPFCGKKFF